MKAYMFPLFTQISKCISNKRKEQIDCVLLIAPVWQAQPWFPFLLEMLIHDPDLLPPYSNLLTSPNRKQIPIFSCMESFRKTHKKKFFFKSGFLFTLPNKNIGLKMLFCKLVALLALTSAGRASELNVYVKL